MYRFSNNSNHRLGWPLLALLVVVAGCGGGGAGTQINSSSEASAIVDAVSSGNSSEVLAIIDPVTTDTGEFFDPGAGGSSGSGSGGGSGSNPGFPTNPVAGVIPIAPWPNRAGESWVCYIEGKRLPNGSVDQFFGIMRPNGTGAQEIARRVGFASISPDGTKFIAKVPGTNPEIAVIHQDGGREVFKSSFKNPQWVSFGPNGREFVFSHEGGLAVGDLETKTERSILSIPGTRALLQPQISPDGEKIVFGIAYLDKSVSLGVYDRNTGSHRVITPSSPGQLFNSWFADNRRVGYVNFNRTSGWEVVRVDTQSGFQEVLYNDKPVHGLAVTKTDRLILGVRAGGVEENEVWSFQPGTNSLVKISDRTRWFYGAPVF